MSIKQKISQGTERRLRTVTGLVLVLASLGGAFMPGLAAAAGQLSARSAALSTSAISATGVSYTISYTTASATQTIKAIRFQACTSPLYNTTCTAPTGFTWNAGAGTLTSQQKNSVNISTNSYTSAASSSDVLISNSTGTSFNTGDTAQFVLGGVRNPSATGQFYIRVVTCNTTTCTMGGGDNIDQGGMAVSATNSMNVTATVQENLVFCAGITTSADCTTVGSASIPLNAGNSSCPILGNSYTCTATSQMTAYTNASSGYSITYTGATLTSGANTITAAPAGGAASTTGTQQFGMQVAKVSGASATLNATYSGSNIAFNSGDSLASTTGPINTETFQVTYTANIDNLAKPGAYTSTINYVCTGTF